MAMTADQKRRKTNLYWRRRYWSDLEYRKKSIENAIKESKMRRENGYYEKRKKDPRTLEIDRARMRRSRAKYYRDNTEKEKQKFREHYANNKEYFKRKNKEHFEAKGDLWRERRRENVLKYDLEHVKGTELNSVLDYLNSDISVEKNFRITFEQALKFLLKLGYTKEEVIGYDSFRRKYEHYLRRIIEEKKSPK